MMAREYTVADLFYTAWHELSGKTHADVYLLQCNILTLEKGSKEYSWTLINILRRLRKRLLLVDKFNVEQAVDIYNDLSFLNSPWYFFPDIRVPVFSGLATPKDAMAQHTFDHFIYADNEFSQFLITREKTYLKRLVATLYQPQFDKEAVQRIADGLRATDWQLNLAFYAYGHVREKVMDRCKALLPRASAAADSEGSASPTGGMWLLIKHRLAETAPFQGYDAAGKANMYAALDYLEDLAQQKKHANP